MASPPILASPRLPARCRFGLFEFDARSGELRREGQNVKLAPQPARVLALLLATPGEVVLRDEFRSHLWGDDTFVDFERGLNFCILQVRTALGDASDNPRFVQTVPRKGYRFIAPVTPIAAPPEPGSAAAPSLIEEPQAPPAPAPSPRDATAGRESRSGPWIAAVAGAVVLVATLGWLAASLRVTSSPIAQAPSRLRIAVLPVVNLTGDATANLLADGLTDEVIAELGQISPAHLAVIARTSSMTYRNTQKTVAQIGQDLAVSFVVESSLRREGEGLRLSASVISTGDQTPIATWSEMFPADDSVSSESQTSGAIRMARSVALKLLPEGNATDLARPTASVAAWTLFLQGRALMNAGAQDDVRRAIAAFEGAVGADPNLAAAWAKIAEARHVLVMMGAAAPLESYPSARIAADRALAAGPSLPESHLANGVVQLWFDWKAADAARSFERAIALNPSSAAAHHDYAWALMALGRTDDAIAQVTLARDLDPLSVRANNDIGWLYLHLRRPADAARACQHTLAIQPGALEPQACLERSYADRGLFDAAVQAALAGVPKAAPGFPDLSGQRSIDALKAIWRWRLSRLEDAAKTRWVSPYGLAVQRTLAGEREGAIDALETAFAQRVGVIAFLTTDPSVDPLRGDPRFQTLLTRIAAARQ